MNRLATRSRARRCTVWTMLGTTKWSIRQVGGRVKQLAKEVLHGASVATAAGHGRRAAGGRTTGALAHGAGADGRASPGRAGSAGRGERGGDRGAVAPRAQYRLFVAAPL